MASAGPAAPSRTLDPAARAFAAFSFAAFSAAWAAAVRCASSSLSLTAGLAQTARS